MFRGRVVNLVRGKVVNLSAFSSETTGWDRNTKQDKSGDKKKKEINSGGGQGALNKIEEIGINKGTMNVRYDMEDIPDKMQIINPLNSKILWETNGKVSKSGGDKNIPIDLEEGTQIQILINPGEKIEKNTTIFYYRIVIIPEPDKKQTPTNESIILEYKPN